MSKLWSPYNLYNNIIGWWDSRDLFANNGLTHPTGNGITTDVGVSYTDTIIDKSIARSNFTSSGTLASKLLSNF